MKTDIAARKQAESAKQLKQVEREQAAAQTFGHRLDTHSMLNKGEGAGIKLIGSKELQKGRPKTALQKKLNANETATNAGPNPRRTIMQQQVAANSAL
jgi:hypothetical protein